MSLGHRPSRLGLVDVVTSEVLRSRPWRGRSRAFDPTLLDLELLDVADAAISARVPLGFVVPAACPGAPVLLAAAAVVGAIRAQRSARVEVAVAAPNLSTAVFYEQLMLHDVRLSDLVGRARVAVDGTVRVPRWTVSRQLGRLYQVGAVDRLWNVIGQLDALVVDAAACSPTALAATLKQTAGQVPVVYVTTSPVDQALEAVRAAGGIVWGWDAASLGPLAALNRPKALASSKTPLLASPDALTAAAGSRLTVASPTTGSLDVALAGLWQGLGKLGGAYRGQPRSQSAAAATRWAWNLYHVAATLPVSAARYDEYVVPAFQLATTRFGEAAAVARAYARTITGPIGQAWYEVANAFEDFVQASAHQEKLQAVLDWVRRRCAANEPAAVLVRDYAAVNAVTAALAESPDTPDGWDQVVRVARTRDLAALTAAGLRNADETDRPLIALCLPGLVPRNAAGLLATPPTKDLLMVTAGPLEAQRAYRAAVDARTAAAKIRWESVALTAGALHVIVRADLEDPVASPADSVTWVAVDPVPDLGEVENPWEPFAVDLLAELAAVAGRTDAPAVPPARVTDAGVEVTAPALAVHVRDVGGIDQVLLVAPNDLLTRRRGGRVERVAAKSLEAADVVLLVDRGAREDLLGTVIGKLSESPAYATLAMLVNFWHLRAGKVRDRSLTYGEVLGRMRGTSITSETTIGGWVRADVDGPLDKADIGRFAAAVGDDELGGQANQVGWALDTLHAVHRKIGSWLSIQMSGAVATESDATVDAALDIYVVDLLDAVSLHTVSAVDAARWVPVALLGTLVNPDDLPEDTTVDVIGDVNSARADR